MDRVVAPNMCRYISVKYEKKLTSFANKINISKETLKKIIGSLVAMLASHLITLPIISYVMLINFMRENKILSYELINELYLSNKQFILMTTFYIVLHAIVHLTEKTSSIILLHGMLIIFVSSVCVMPNNFASRLFSIGLQEFSVGGNIPATIYHQSARFGENVKIILHTPKTLFFRKGNVVGLIPGDKINMIVYRNKTVNKENTRN
ncbi:hypothetical protein [Brenneria izbisi]|uniref:Uncharacterized protein n=1 Tax=Brenneria izbisi TaxID=2939450 RepID=A0AA41XV39_9GAMM|nr:hypothetical protein [Brenneria izbisi]MCV9879243.1 hypothetical protein [Brenneria izbisi]MCV9882723.1 hypothetical protein [Brenneria izbisi]